jgi:hypothetical protein
MGQKKTTTVHIIMTSELNKKTEQERTQTKVEGVRRAVNGYGVCERVGENKKGKHTTTKNTGTHTQQKQQQKSTRPWMLKRKIQEEQEEERKKTKTVQCASNSTYCHSPLLL